MGPFVGFSSLQSSTKRSPFLGVHTGHLGFYTDWRDYELPELVNSLSCEQGKSVSYPLLDVLLTTTDGEQKHFWH